MMAEFGLFDNLFKESSYPVLACHTKISLAGSILTENLPKLVPQVTFAVKIGSAILI